jgi:DNA-binding XRE family transcriptional regulator
VLERRQLDLMDARLPRSGGPLVLSGQLDAVQELAQIHLSFWLCTHWPSSTTMARMRAEERFAANLRRLRLEQGLSQEGLAERTGLHPTEISRLERAVREPRLGTMLRLAKGLGVGVDSLVAGIR